MSAQRSFVPALLAALGGLLLATVAGSCGYSTRMSAGPDAETIGLEYFDNQSDLRDIEAPLYDALSRAIVERVSAPLVAPERADLVVRGTVLEYERRGGIRSTTNRLLETGVRLQVRAWLFDRVAGLAVGQPVESTVDVGYVVADATGDPSTPQMTRRNRVLEVTNELEARERALRNVSERLVLDLFGGMN